MKSFSFAPRFNRLWKKDEGQALLLTSVGLLMLLGMAGLGVDVGYLKYQRHQMQKAADAGALAAATVMTYSSSDTLIKKAALNDAAANGYTDGTSNVTVTINHPPATGPFAGNNNYVEVYVGQPRPNFFMKVFGYATTDVRARAVGSSKADASGCIYALDPHDPNGFLVDGNVTVASTCGIQVNSDDNLAMRENGNSGAITVVGGDGIGVVGNYSGNNFTPTPDTGIARVTDPYLGLAPPAFVPSSCVLQNPSATSFTPGCYKKGITISDSRTYTFAAGTYILYGGGLTIKGSAKVSGTDVFFYNTGTATGATQYGPINIGGSSSTNLSASLDPSNAYAGMLFFQDRNYISTKNPDTSTIDGSNGAVFVGALYFPGTDLKFSGTPGIASSTVIVAWQIEFTGNTTLNNEFLNDGGSPLKTAGLAE